MSYSSVHKNIKILTWLNFFTDLRFFAPVLILYYQRVTGSYTLALSILSVVFISAALFEIPTGIFSDKIGRKKTVLLGTACCTLGLFLYAVGGSYWMLVLGAVFEGLSRSFYSGNNDALLHETLQESGQEHEYHSFLGKTSSMFQIAAAVAAIIGGILASVSFGFVMWISVVPQMLCFLLALLISEPKIHLKESSNVYEHLKLAFKQLKQNSKLRLLALSNIVNFGAGNAGFEFQAAFYALLWPTWALGIARTIANASGAIGYYFSGRLIDKFGPVKILVTETTVVPVAKIISAIFPTPVSPVIMASGSLLYGAQNVANNSLLQKGFSNEQRATMGSIVSLGGSLFFALSAFVIGIIADRWGVVSAIILVQCVLLSLVFVYKKLQNMVLK